MLVRTKEPMGYTTIDGKRVYGEGFSYGRFAPTEITYKLYREYKEVLKEVPITGEWLSERFGGKFPDVSLTYENTYENITFDELIDVARNLGVNYIKSARPTRNEKRALRRTVISIIDSSS